MSEPLVSIVIPLYNYQDFIIQCIESCLEQSYKNIEVLVVDDHSTDNSWTTLEEYYHKKRDYRLRIFRNDVNKGYSYCKNYGIKMSKGEYIAHLDSDDFLTPKSIEIRLQHFLNAPSLDMVHGKAWKWRWNEEEREWEIDGYNPNSSIHAQGVLIKRSVFKRFGLYYEALRAKSDKEMWNRLGVHPKSKLPTLINARKIDNFVAYYRKHLKQLHRIRRQDDSIGRPINKIFKQRMNDLKKNGVTKENTLFLK